MSDSTVSEQASSPESLYQRVGGQTALVHVVDLFYQRILADDQLRPYFTGVDMGNLKRHQAAMLTKVLGGPDRYSGRDLGSAHAGLDITPEAYGRVGEHLLGVLQEANVDATVLDAVADVLNAVQPTIVSASSAGNGAREQA